MLLPLLLLLLLLLLQILDGSDPRVVCFGDSSFGRLDPPSQLTSGSAETMCAGEQFTCAIIAGKLDTQESHLWIRVCNGNFWSEAPCCSLLKVTIPCPGRLGSSICLHGTCHDGTTHGDSVVF
jgi:hypothetical protein